MGSPYSWQLWLSEVHAFRHDEEEIYELESEDSRPSVYTR